MTAPLTLFDKLWTQQQIGKRDGEALLWVDRHYVHEGSFHAFSRLAERGAGVAEPGLTFGVADHYVPPPGAPPAAPSPIPRSRAWCASSMRIPPGTMSKRSASTTRGRESCTWSAPSR